MRFHYVMMYLCTQKELWYQLQRCMLKEFHIEYPGIFRMKSLMRCYTYWPKMDQDIKNLVKSCRGWTLAAKSLPIKILPWLKTDIPWSRIYIDFTGLLNRAYYLVVVDSYTKWPEILKCRRPTTVVMINFLHKIFGRFGVPDSIVSDNGTQFTSSEFKFSLQIISNRTYYNFPLSPKIKRKSGMVCRYI